MWALDIETYQGSLETAGVRMIITHLMMFPLRSPEVEEIISTSEFILILESGERISTTVLQYYSKVLFKTVCLTLYVIADCSVGKKGFLDQP